MRRPARNSCYVLVLICTFSVLDIALAITHRCIHHEILAEGVLNSAAGGVTYRHQAVIAKQVYHNNNGRHILADDSTSWAGIRIQVDVSQVTLEGADREFLARGLLPTTLDWFNLALRVNPVKGRLYLQPDPNAEVTLCGTAIIPSQHLEGAEGVEADYIFYVTSESTSAGVLAYSMWCQIDQFGRPIAGYINVNPDVINLNPINWETQVSVLLHEMMHGLGFTSNSYAMYRDKSGNVRGLQNVVKWFTSPTLKRTYEIITPTVTRFAREHFNCSDLDGAWLENQGGSSTAGSHWEKKIFMEELMTGSIDYNPVISRLSLALFEDTGWYMPNYTVTEPLAWGRLAQCEFLFGKCLLPPKSDPVSLNPRHFCAEDGQQRCLHSGVGKGLCSISTYADGSIPDDFQYFSDPNLGGEELPDYCPIYEKYVRAGTLGTDSDCRKAYNDLVGSPMGETWCPNCRCFLVENMAAVGLTPSEPSACFNFTCGLDAVLRVFIGQEGASVECLTTGGVVAAPAGYSGNIVCPPWQELCEPKEPLTREGCPSHCSGRGMCWNGTCVCPPAWEGEDCNRRYCPEQYIGNYCNATGFWDQIVYGLASSQTQNRFRPAGTFFIIVALLVAVAVITIVTLLVLLVATCMRRNRVPYQRFPEHHWGAAPSEASVTRA